MIKLTLIAAAVLSGVALLPLAMAGDASDMGADKSHTAAAELLGVKPSTLFSRMKSLGIQRPQ